jgi:hypothetical protein
MVAKQDSNFTQTLPFAGACRQHYHIVPTECTNLVGVPLIKKNNLNLLLFSILECVSAFHGMFYLEYKHCRIVDLLILHRPTVLLFVFVYKCPRLLKSRPVRTLEKIAY